MVKAANRRGNGDQAKYGIAEWYGRLYRKLSSTERMAFLNPAHVPECPFLAAVPDLAPLGSTRCSKKGGVCSIRNFTQTDDHDVRFGPITSTCPNRFLENRTVIEHIGKLLLDTPEVIVAKEIPFLRRVNSSPIEDDTEGTSDPFANISEDGNTLEDVGKIDLVFMHPSKEPKDWCAVEIQAVYFSGGAMSKDYEVIKRYVGNGVPMPGVARRPDFRSSGPKRLMPQLQIKVPTLRRWGKKMVVIIDRPFYNAMAPMSKIEHISNCDIVWVVINYEDSSKIDTASLFIDEVIYTTLEDSVIGLTAGTPTTLPEFEKKLVRKAARARAQNSNNQNTED